MYEQKISRANPGHITMLIDDSGSEDEPLAGTNDPKYKWIEFYLKAILYLLLQRSTESKGDDQIIKPRYYLSIIQYGSYPQFWGDQVMDIESVIEKFTDNGDSMGLGGHLGGTDTKSAMELAYDNLKKVVKDEKFQNSYPPILFHLTDGEAHTDASSVAEKIKQLSTTDGNVLVINGYIGTQTNLNYKAPEDFPGYVDVSEVGSSEDNIGLFEMSSVVPAGVEENLKKQNIFPNIRPDSRLFFDVRTKEMLREVIQSIGSFESRMAR